LVIGDWCGSLPRIWPGVIQVKSTETPSRDDAATVVRSRLGLEPVEIQRFLTGLCHYVFSVTTSDRQKFVVRIATPSTKRLLAGGIYWNELLRPIAVPLPRSLAADLEPSEIHFPFVVLEQLPGSDLGQIYQTLTSPEKLEIVSEVVRIRKKVSPLPEALGFGFAYSYSEPPEYRSWKAAVLAILERAQERMNRSGHPGASYVARARQALGHYETYFAGVRPVPFLDDTTTKNVLVEQGRLTGVVDIDQLCFGDPLLTIGLTKMALRANAYDADYVGHWMNLLDLSQQSRQVVDAYTLLFCVVFMSELGQRFNKEDEAEIDVEKLTRLESIFETLAH
jgi:aminoglycoside phosphotransferase (APT) family kinase protein